MRNINDLEYKLLQSSIDYNLPTLFISECVLVYNELVHSQRLLLWISSKFHEALFVNYEQVRKCENVEIQCARFIFFFHHVFCFKVNMSDRFGEVMTKNLRERGCSLAGLEACKNLDTQKQRYI